MNQTVLITGAGSGFGLGASLERRAGVMTSSRTTQILAQITGGEGRSRGGWSGTASGEARCAGFR